MFFLGRVFVVFGLLVAPAAAQDAGIWAKRIEDDARREVFTLTARKPNYVLVTYMKEPNQAPYEFTGSPDRLQNQEVKFQLSLQTKMADDLFGGNGDLWFGGFAGACVLRSGRLLRFGAESGVPERGVWCFREDTENEND